MAATTSSVDGRRIAYVDGLRAIAVLLVVVHHTAKWNDGLGQGLIQQICSKGAHGVDLFFVLSGFCLSYPVLRELHSKGWATFDAAGYMARRVVRIVPPFWLAIVVLSVFLWSLPHFGWQIQEMFSLFRVNWFEIGKQALFIDRRPEFVNPSFWTLPVEWRWYFLFPLFLTLWTRSARTFVTVTVVCSLGAALTRVGGFDLGLLPGFLLGIIAAEIELRHRVSGRLMALLCLLSVVVALAMESFYVLEVQPGWQLAAFFFVLAAGSQPALRRLMSARPLVWIGITSYSIYLLHEPIIGAIEHNTTLNPFVAGTCGVLAGIAFWAACERPFMTRALKQPLVGFLRSPLQRLCALAGLPDSIELKRITQTVNIAPGAAADVEPATVLAAANPGRVALAEDIGAPVREF